MKNENYNIIILAAMPEEISSFIKHLNKVETLKYGDLTIYKGRYKNNHKVRITLAWSGWGKVSASRAVSRMIALASISAPIDLILFTGVAGGVDPELSQWDLVISKEVLQHDMDARPLFEKFVIPSLNKDRLVSDNALNSWAEKLFKKNKALGKFSEFGKIKCGLIATGDKFINDKNLLNDIKKDLDDLLAVEMEGAAVAQVAEQEGLPWLILRVISDSADESAKELFPKFIENYKKSSWILIETLVSNLDSAPIFSKS